MNLDKILNTNEVIENYIHSIWKLTENYIRLNLEFWRQLRTISGSIWISGGDWELYPTQSRISGCNWELYLAQSKYLGATENYIWLNLKIWRWLRTISSSIRKSAGYWELYPTQSEIWRRLRTISCLVWIFEGDRELYLG